MNSGVKKMKKFFLILLLVGKTSNILALPRYEKLDGILSPCSGALIMYAQKRHLSTQIYKFFWVTALSILNALNSNFSGFHWKPKIKCSEDLYVNCGKTTKLNIQKHASFPSPKKIGTQENKCIHCNIYSVIMKQYILQKCL